jgi:hypothetical protein
LYCDTLCGVCLLHLGQNVFLDFGTTTISLYFYVVWVTFQQVYFFTLFSFSRLEFFDNFFVLFKFYVFYVFLLLFFVLLEERKECWECFVGNGKIC